ncbi:hypothetical protein FRC07_013569 [Ceratobasidium sp. 392]|nr:hypothetical protein FRC07_013569 [Ceratobasidium sp. 392]
MLGSTMGQLISVNQRPHPGLKPYVQQLHWYRTSDEQNNLACLPAVGGITQLDIQFLTASVSKSLGALQQVNYPSPIFGFATLLFLFWQYLAYLEPQPTTVVLLQNMVIRYWPAALDGEHKILRYIFRWLDKQTTRSGGTPRLITQNPGDMQQLVESYTRHIFHESGEEMLPLEDAVRLVEFLRRSQGLNEQVAGLFVPLLCSGISRCWLEMDAYIADRRTWELVVQLCSNTLELLTPVFVTQEVLTDLMAALGSK